MQGPPVQLRHYFFPVVSVTADPAFVPNQDGPILPEISYNVQLAVNEENKNLHQVELDLTIASQSDKPIPYKVTLKAIGFIETNPEVEDQQGMVYTHGTAILYSAAREFLMGIMCRGPWSPIMLPITFISPKDIAQSE